MKKFINGFGYAFKGIVLATKTQLNFRVHLIAMLLTIITGALLKISSGEWLWIILCFALVLTAELFNTAIEIITDMISPNFNEKAGAIKDVAAGAVLITAIFALITGCIILLPKIFTLLFYAT
jgi:diacylglycerol kinase